MSMVEDDNSGAIPVSDPQDQAQQDNSGAAPVTGGGAIDTSDQQQATPTPGTLGAQAGAATADAIGSAVKRGVAGGEAGAQGASNGIGKGVKSIVSYLMGAGAAPPEALDQAGAKVDPQGSMSADDRNLLAVEQANKEGGPQAAWALVQANRVAYNAKQAFASTALNGINGKPADLNAATDAANQASQHILDGSSVNFKPNQQGGVTATVTVAGSSAPKQIDLSGPQFNQWLNVGGDGQWDKVMENGGAAATLARIAQGPGQPLKGGQAPGQPPQATPGQVQVGAAAPRAQPQAPGQAPAQAPSQTPATPQDAPAPQPQTNFGTTPSTVNLSGDTSIRPPEKDQTNYGSELEARALRMFPHVSQEEQRNQWMAAQETEEENRKNKIDVAGETGKQRIKVAEATGRSRENVASTTTQGRVQTQDRRSQGNLDVAKVQADARLQGMKQKAVQAALQQERLATDNAAKERARNFRAMITNPNYVLQKPEDLQAAAAKAGINLGGAPTPAQGQQQSPPPQSGAQNTQPGAAANPQQPPVQGAKFYQGKWYTRGPNGESVPYQQ